MATVVNRSQQVTREGISPKASYTRVVSCVQTVPPGPGAVYSTTPKLGNDLWLFKVKVWSAPKAINNANQTGFRIMAGTVPVASAGEILEWENLLPLYSPGFGNESWANYDGSSGFEWTMKRRFQGQGYMFGFWAERGPVGADVLFASFEISEG